MIGPDFLQAERGLPFDRLRAARREPLGRTMSDAERFAIRFRRNRCGGSFDAALVRLAQG
jgi:hypothetical protein